MRLARDRAPPAAQNPATARLPCLDGWRGLAVALVLMGHFMPMAGWGIESTGVDLFFVLSGRLIAQVLFIDATPLDRFVWRRLARVLPSLILFVLVVGPLHGVTGRSQPADLPPLTFTANYTYAAGGEPLFFGHLWSLCIEEHAYLALVAVALIHRWRGGGAASMLFALGLACLTDLVISEAVFGQRDVEVLWRTDARAGALILSAALHLAIAPNLQRWAGRRWAGLVPLLAFAAGVALCRKGVPEVVQFGLGGIFFALAINTVDAAPAAAIRQLECPTLRMLGRWSYSLYLWQQPFFILACLADPVWRLPLLAAAISTGMAAFMLVESPSRRGLNQLWTRIERRCRPSAVLATGAGRRIRSEAA